MKCQIDEHLDRRRDLLVIRQFNRHGLALGHDSAVRGHDARLLRELALTHAPAVHQADARADRLVRRVRQTVENPDEHKLSIALLAHVVT